MKRINLHGKLCAATENKLDSTGSNTGSTESIFNNFFFKFNYIDCVVIIRKI